MKKLSQYIESIIFVAESPISIEDIQDSLEASIQLKVKKDKIEKEILLIQDKFHDESFSFELIAISKGYQFMTKGAYHDVVGHYLRIQSKKKLSRAALETLAIIAYKQPLTKSGIESIRGVNCDYAVQKLVEKELVEILGRSDGPGRPLLYGTSDKFMDYFGIQNISDLPKLKEIIVTENNIGMEQGLEKLNTEGLTEDFKFKNMPPVEEDAPEHDDEKIEVEQESTIEHDSSSEAISDSTEEVNEPTRESNVDLSLEIEENNVETIEPNEDLSAEADLNKTEGTDDFAENIEPPVETGEVSIEIETESPEDGNESDEPGVNPLNNT